MAGNEFAEGIRATLPRPNAPEFILMNLGLDRLELIKWLQTFEDDYIDVSVLSAKKTGKPYVALNTYNKEYKRAGASEQGEQAAPAKSGKFDVGF